MLLIQTITNYLGKTQTMKILVIDIETTGFLDKGGKIVELGACSLDLDTGYIDIEFDVIIKEPGLTAKDHDAWIFQNSDLKVEHVRTAMPSDTAFKLFQEVVDRFPDGVTAFNRDFDVNFLISRGIKFGKLQPCPMKVATDVCKIPSPYGGFKYPKVTEAYEIFFPEYDYTEAHRGLSDCIDEAVLIYYLYKKGHYKPI